MVSQESASKNLWALGIAKINGGHSYIGQISEDGKATGYGIIRYSQGGSYEGSFLDNKRHGFGRYYFIFLIAFTYQVFGRGPTEPMLSAGLNKITQLAREQSTCKDA